MKLYVFILMVVFLLPSTIMAQISLFTKVSESKNAPCATVYATKNLGSNTEFTFFGLVQEKWAEAQVGVAHSPANWVSVGISAGIEQTSAIWRTGAFLWLGSGKTSFSLFVEKGEGEDNYWYKSTLAVKPIDNLSVGVRAWRFNGVGPLIQYQLNDVSLWVMPAYEFEADKKNLLIGVDVKL